MGTNYYVALSKPSVQGPVAHIGKSSGGWLFLFHDMDDKWNDPPIVWHTYEQVMDWLKKNTSDDLSKEYCIMDEYDRIVSFDEFKELVDNKQSDVRCINNDQNFKYCKDINGYRFEDGEFS